MGSRIEATDGTVVDKKITENFLHLHNLLVTKFFENAPTLVWEVESLDNPYYPSHIRRPNPPIVLTRLAGKNKDPFARHDTVSIQVNRSFTEFKRRQQILAVYYLGQLSLEHGSLDSVTLDQRLGPQTLHRIIDVLQYSTNSDVAQLLNDLADEHGSRYTRFPLG